MLSNEEVTTLEAAELTDLLRGLLDYEQTLSYTGTLSVEELKSALDAQYTLPEALTAVPQRQVLANNQPAETQIYFLTRKRLKPKCALNLAASPIAPI